MARRWIEQWGDHSCPEISEQMIEEFVLLRSRVSPDTANKEIRYLRAMFNLAKKKGWLRKNPTDGIRFLPVEKSIKYVPSSEDVERVIAAADADTKDYLIAIRDTMARMSEINRLTWNDVDLSHQAVTLYTRKKKGGHLTPRKVPMTERLFKALSRRHAQRDLAKPWVFWHTYWSSKTGEKCDGPYQERKKIMRTLCRRAGVRYFRFHALRHSGASLLDENDVSIGTIQRILGHENRSTTEVYLHSISETEREAMGVFDRAKKKSHIKSHIGLDEG